MSQISFLPMFRGHDGTVIGMHMNLKLNSVQCLSRNYLNSYSFAGPQLAERAFAIFHLSSQNTR